MAGDYTSAGQQPEPVPSDYDENPGRVRLARSVLRRHAVTGDVHELVAGRFVAEGFARVLDVGCGEGELARHLPNSVWTGLDNSQTMLDRAPAGGVRGEAGLWLRPDQEGKAKGVGVDPCDWSTTAKHTSPSSPITARNFSSGVVLACVDPLEGGRICPR
jgi:SAM-dependent methyltransferase